MNDELNAEKNKNKKLKDELNAVKNKNKKLNDEELDKYQNNQLNNETNNSQNNLNMEIEKLKKEKMDLQNQINNLNNQILSSNKEINNVKMNKKSNIAFINPGEKIICVLFKSFDKKIELTLPCKNTDIFVRLEEQLYERFPEYKETNNKFTCNGIIIKRFKSLVENNIKCSDVILLNNE